MQTAEERINATKERVMTMAQGATELQGLEIRHAHYKATILACIAWFLSLSAFVFTIPIIILAIKLGAFLWGM